MKRILRSGDVTHEALLSLQSAPPSVSLDGAAQEVRIERLSETEILLWRGNVPKRFVVLAQKNGDVLLTQNGESFTFRVEEPNRKRSQESESSLSSPMPGKVIRVNKQPGDSVQKGEAIIVVEAMKMELPIKAPRDGVVKKVSCQAGERIAAGATLVEME
jgi:3-methylcrotonyl-CoA carboxylase alpha subunit